MQLEITMTYNWNLSPEANRAKTEAQIRRKIYAPPTPTPLTTTQEKKTMTPLANALYLSPAEIESQLGESVGAQAAQAAQASSANPLYTPKPAVGLGQKPKPSCTKCGNPIDKHAQDCKYNPAGMKARAEAAIQAAPKPAPAPAPAAPHMSFASLMTQLKFEHLRGCARRLTIAGLTFDDTWTGKATEKKPALHFIECPMKLTLNESQKLALFILFGNVEAAKGKKITIYPARARNGRNVIGIATSDADYAQMPFSDESAF
jgi:hypothetical protein